MREALEIAREGLEKGELPIGAVVVLDGETSPPRTQRRKRKGVS
jgi:tRNA(Arg) A34 adenosine deaminase TadA